MSVEYTWMTYPVAPHLWRWEVRTNTPGREFDWSLVRAGCADTPQRADRMAADWISAQQKKSK